jgi:hypothetical protein
VNIFLVIFGTAALYGAVRFALGIWIPKQRGNWNGPFTGRPSKNDPDNMQRGVVTHVGGAILWTGFALGCFVSLFGGATPKSPGTEVLPRIFMAPILIGFFLVMLGWSLDSSAHDAARRGPRLPGEPRITTEELLHRWIPVVCGTVILLMMAYALIFFK